MFLELTRKTTGTKLLINMDNVEAMLTETDSKNPGTILYYGDEKDDLMSDSYESIRGRLVPRVEQSEV